MPEGQENFFNFLNFVFSIIFTLEVLIKLIGLGLNQFARDRFNLFDALIMVLSIVELALSSGGSGSFSAMRAFRLFRVFKVFRIGDLRILLDSIAFTMTTIGNYVILLLLFIYVYALIGMRFFGGKLKFDEDGTVDRDGGMVPRANFDSLIWSSVTIF